MSLIDDYREDPNWYWRAEPDAEGIQLANEFKAANPANWENLLRNNEGNPFGLGIIACAQRWGALMQRELANGGLFDEFYDRTFDLANNVIVEGGFNTRDVTKVVASHWEHKEEFVAYYNKRVLVQQRARLVADIAELDAQLAQLETGNTQPGFKAPVNGQSTSMQGGPA